MAGSNSWYEDEDLWHTWGPLLFSNQRVANAAVEIDQILVLIDIHSKARILDLCCGIGRHSLELARRGFRVTGVDRTREYLAMAEGQAKKEGLKIEFVREDMRNFCRPESFDVVINLFTSFGYFDNQSEDRKVVNNMYTSLKSGGVVVMDLSSKEVLAGKFRERDWRETDGVFWLEERKLIDDWSRIQNRWILFKDNQRFENTINLRLYSAAELSILLQTAGFTRISAYGGFDGIPYDNHAGRLVMVGHKDWKGVPYGSPYSGL